MLFQNAAVLRRDFFGHFIIVLCNVLLIWCKFEEDHWKLLAFKAYFHLTHLKHRWLVFQWEALLTFLGRCVEIFSRGYVQLKGRRNKFHFPFYSLTNQKLLPRDFFFIIFPNLGLSKNARMGTLLSWPHRPHTHVRRKRL